MTEEKIHNIYLHMSGKAEGIAEATGAADFPVLFAHAILEYAKRPWVGLTNKDFLEACQIAEHGNYLVAFQRIQTKLKERNT